MKKDTIIGIIPSRYESSRFPGKPLALIAGKTLIQRTYENAQRCTSLDRLVVATDDDRIMEHVVSFGGEAVLTSTSCQNGSERLAEVITIPEFSSYSHIVNIQGDEPILNPQTIDAIISCSLADPSLPIITAVNKLTDPARIDNPSIVKCVFDNTYNALYFSRSPIPYQHNASITPTYHQHLGLYLYRKDFLLTYSSLPTTPLQQAESLEQLKILEQGYPIRVVIVNDHATGVDTPEDIQTIERLLCIQNTSSLQEESLPL